MLRKTAWIAIDMLESLDGVHRQPRLRPRLRRGLSGLERPCSSRLGPGRLEGDRLWRPTGSSRSSGTAPRPRPGCAAGCSRSPWATGWRAGPSWTPPRPAPGDDRAHAEPGLAAPDQAAGGLAGSPPRRRPQLPRRGLRACPRAPHGGHDRLGPGSTVDAPPNVWLGVSVEDQARADGRIPRLLEIPAAVRFLSGRAAAGAGRPEPSPRPGRHLGCALRLEAIPGAGGGQHGLPRLGDRRRRERPRGQADAPRLGAVDPRSVRYSGCAVLHEANDEEGPDPGRPFYPRIPLGKGYLIEEPISEFYELGLEERCENFTS
jgi:hypothetical protein